MFEHRPYSDQEKISEALLGIANDAKSSGISSNRWYEFLGRSSAKKAKEKFSLAFFSSGFFWMDSKSHRAVRWVADFSMRFLQLTERIDDELEIPGCLTE